MIFSQKNALRKNLTLIKSVFSHTYGKVNKGDDSYHPPLYKTVSRRIVFFEAVKKDGVSSPSFTMGKSSL